MNETGENPFRSPLSSQDAVPRSIRVRHIAGLGAHLVAGYAAFIGVASAIALSYKWLHHQLSERDRVGFEGMVFGSIFAVVLAWTGHRLRTRPHGKVEWTIVLLLLFVFVAGDSIGLVRYLRSAEHALERLLVR